MVKQHVAEHPAFGVADEGEGEGTNRNADRLAAREIEIIWESSPLFWQTLESFTQHLARYGSSRKELSSHSNSIRRLQGRTPRKFFANF